MFCLSHSTPITVMSFVAKKGFIHEAAKQGDRRRDPEPNLPKTGLRDIYSIKEQGNLRHEEGKLGVSKGW